MYFKSSRVIFPILSPDLLYIRAFQHGTYFACKFYYLSNTLETHKPQSYYQIKQNISWDITVVFFFAGSGCNFLTRSSSSILELIIKWYASAGRQSYSLGIVRKNFCYKMTIILGLERLTLEIYLHIFPGMYLISSQFIIQ